MVLSLVFSNSLSDRTRKLRQQLIKEYEATLPGLQKLPLNIVVVKYCESQPLWQVRYDDEKLLVGFLR